jgi:hypothetical protein
MKILLLASSFTLNIFAQDEYKAHCIILEDENSILCKYKAPASIDDRRVIINWIDPDDQISRYRELQIPAEYISVYDYRYLKGRKLGLWKFEVVDGDTTTVTNFTIKKRDN